MSEPCFVSSLQRVMPSDLDLTGEVDMKSKIRVGNGDYAQVYTVTCRNSSFENRICLKVLEFPVDESGDFNEGVLQRRFEREVMIWSKLEHPNITPFYGWALEMADGLVNACLLSQYCVNRNALLYLKMQPDANRVSLVKDIADGLHYLHGRDVIHGDIKPKNVLVNNEGRAMLCDFGLAMILQDVFTHPLTDSRYTTPRFSAPELMEDSGPIPPSRTKFTDVWAFSCTGMEIIRRVQPYHGLTHNQLVIEMNRRRGPPYRNFENNPWESVLARCLVWCPNDRIVMSDVIGQLEADMSPQHLLRARVENTNIRRPWTIAQVATRLISLLISVRTSNDVSSGNVAPDI